MESIAKSNSFQRTTEGIQLIEEAASAGAAFTRNALEALARSVSEVLGDNFSRFIFQHEPDRAFALSSLLGVATCLYSPPPLLVLVGSVSIGGYVSYCKAGIKSAPVDKSLPLDEQELLERQGHKVVCELGHVNTLSSIFFSCLGALDLPVLGRELTSTFLNGVLVGTSTIKAYHFFQRTS
ncbi:MAG: hypothetical protein S4CHLAM7_10930 [Chlamydiae bacterium]|nr:hypothetical protein [Chlamydiota bacterium]